MTNATPADWIPDVPLDGNNAVDKWPDSIDEAAYYGLAGEIVRVIDPHSEADPVAVLIQLLVAFGNAIHRNPYFVAEADHHHCKLFAVLVGETSKGRKGASWGQVRRLFDAAEPEWAKTHIVGGLSSGEGLIWAVRDPITKREPVYEGKGKEKRVVGYNDIEVDSGVLDKRLLVMESEFALVLKVMARDSNTLSAIIRQAWDRGDLRTLTKNSPAQATETHISIVGHITRDELRRYLTVTESGNGFGNRFLWLCVRRSKCLPEGGRLQVGDLDPLAKQLRDAVQFTRSVGEMRRDDEARKVWAEVYPSLSDGKPGLLGAMTSRAEAQVMRLACIYALLDESDIIRTEHLLAALSVWDYAEASARHIFGSKLGDPVTDKILTALTDGLPDGLTRTEISNLFGRHQVGAAIDQAISTLQEQGLIRQTVEKTGGRPAKRWFAITNGR
jgi:hypothetical protein